MEVKKQNALVDGIAAVVHELASPLGVLSAFVEDSRRGIQLKEQDFLDASSASNSLLQFTQALRHCVRCLTQDEQSDGNIQETMLSEFAESLGYTVCGRDDQMHEVGPSYFLRQVSKEGRQQGLAFCFLLLCLEVSVYCDSAASRICFHFHHHSR